MLRWAGAGTFYLALIESYPKMLSGAAGAHICAPAAIPIASYIYEAIGIVLVKNIQISNNFLIYNGIVLNHRNPSQIPISLLSEHK